MEGYFAAGGMFCTVADSHFDFDAFVLDVRIDLTAYIEEQKRTGLSIQLFAEKVNSPGYRVPIKTKVYENIDF